MTRLEPLLKTRQLAETLGVSVSTVKRWVDAGALRSTRTVGKHRLVPLAEALRFARERDLPSMGLLALAAAGPASLSAIDERARRALVVALKQGRAAEARALIGAAYATAGGASRLADDLIRPVMERIGHEWGAGDLDVYQEHRASRIVESALMGLIARFEPAPSADVASLALGAGPEGDPYTLAGWLCELALRELGWDVINLGPNLPLASLARAVQAHRPRLVWISVGHLADRERFVREYRAFHEAASAAGAAVCLGGSALDLPLRARLVAASFGERIAHLAEFARRIGPSVRTTTPAFDTSESRG